MITLFSPYSRYKENCRRRPSLRMQNRMDILTQIHYCGKVGIPKSQMEDAVLVKI